MDEIILDEGKYKFYIKNDALCCDRHGEKWRKFLGDKAVLSLFHECLELKRKLSDVRESLLYMEKMWETSRLEIDRKIAQMEQDDQT